MMTKQSLMPWWDHMRQANGIALRLIEALPSDKIDACPIPNVRSPKELLVHVYGSMLRTIPAGVVRGEIAMLDERAMAAGIRSKDDLLRACRECWGEADRAVQAVTDAQLQAIVKTPWGTDLPGHICMGVIHDEFFHHRGQLYAVLRALGRDVPMMWDFAHNAPEFRPQPRA
jgi:uncharacterized damage-inducible protein DinB